MGRMTLELDGTDLEASAAKGNKQWVAVITDTHPKYNYDREFVAYQKPKTSDRDSGTASVEEGDVVEETWFSHGGKEKGRVYYQVVDGELHEIDDADVEDALEGIVVEAESEDGEDSDDENPDEGENPQEDEPELVADGGSDDTDHVDDETIKAAIARHDDPDHPDATTVAEMRELLGHVQQSVEEGWDVYMDHIEDGKITVVSETRDLLVLSTGEHKMYDLELEETYDGDVDLDDVTLDVLNGLMHEVARSHSQYDWGVTYPLVVRKPADFEAGREYAERHLMWLMDECGLSGGVALDYYMTEWRGLSQSAWATRAGKDQGTVSQNVSKAKQHVVR